MSLFPSKPVDFALDPQPEPAALNKALVRIAELKRELNAVILSHNYVVPELQDIGDFLGDSLELARKAASTDADVIVFLGVTFMGETVKILSPGKQVLMPRLDARCPMAEMVGVAQVERMKELYPRAPVVAYVNTRADVKAISDICCTSANAVKIVESLDADEVIFVPDSGLGNYVQRNTKKKIHLSSGYCPTHHRIIAEDIIRLKAEHPGSCVLVHPECTNDVLDLADRIGSTSAILRFVGELKDEYEKFIIGTEKGLIYRLQKQHPGKQFFLPSQLIVCPTMKRNRLEHVVECMELRTPEIVVPEHIRIKALRAVEAMLAVT